MGQAPAGLNATGESDIRWFYDTVRSKQSTALRPILNRLVKLLMIADGGKEPNDWSVSFRPLWQLSPLELADLRLKQSQTDKNYVEMDVLIPEEVRVSRFGGNEYSAETRLDDDARNEYDEALEAEAEAALPTDLEPVNQETPGAAPGKVAPPGRDDQ
jgi:hypothetical protein